jgi:hypothetical protein
VIEGEEGRQRGGRRDMDVVVMGEGSGRMGRVVEWRWWSRVVLQEKEQEEEERDMGRVVMKVKEEEKKKRKRKKEKK